MSTTKAYIGLDVHKDSIAVAIAPRDLKNRGLDDIFIACVDGLTGFPDAVKTVYPKTQVQLCIVHMIRHSLRYVSWKQREEVAAGLKTI